MAERLNERGLNVYLCTKAVELAWLIFLLRQWELSAADFGYYFGLSLALMIYFTIRRFPARSGQEQTWKAIHYGLLLFFIALQCLEAYLNDHGTSMKVAFALTETAITAIAGVRKKNIRPF